MHQNNGQVCGRSTGYACVLKREDGTVVIDRGCRHAGLMLAMCLAETEARLSERNSARSSLHNSHVTVCENVLFLRTICKPRVSYFDDAWE